MPSDIFRCALQPIECDLYNDGTFVGCVGDIRENNSACAFSPIPCKSHNISCFSCSSNPNGLSSYFQDDLNISNEQRNVDTNSLDLDPYLSLKNIRSTNIYHLIISQLNINSLKSKFLCIINLIKHIDILVWTETKLDESYPKSQFLIEGYSPTFWQDRNLNGGGVMIYIREDIPCKVLYKHNAPDNFEGIFLELKLREI